MIGAQRGVGLFQLLEGEHWMKTRFIHATVHGAYVRRTIALGEFSVTFTQPKNRAYVSWLKRRHEVDSCGSDMKKSYSTWSKSGLLSAGIQIVPGKTYDLRNRAVPRIVSNLSASASQSTWAQVLPQPQNNLASAGRFTRQERVKTPVNTTQRMGDVEQAGGVHWLVYRTEGDHRNCSCHRKKMWSTYTVASCKVTSPYKWEIFSLDEGNNEEMDRENNPAFRDYSRTSLEIVARHTETPWKSDTARVGWNSKDARFTKENAYSHKTYV